MPPPLYTLLDFTLLLESVPDSEGPPSLESILPPASPLLSKLEFFANSESEVPHPSALSNREQTDRLMKKRLDESKSWQEFIYSEKTMHKDKLCSGSHS